MKVKELYKKYKGYTIMLFGKPLKEAVKGNTPFTHLPKDKEIDECEVAELKVEEGKEKNITISFKDYKTRTEVSKGNVYAYIK